MAKTPRRPSETKPGKPPPPAARPSHVAPVAVPGVRRSPAGVSLSIDDGKRTLRARLTVEQWRAMCSLPVAEAKPASKSAKTKRGEA